MVRAKVENREKLTPQKFSLPLTEDENPVQDRSNWSQLLAGLVKSGPTPLDLMDECQIFYYKLFAATLDLAKCT